MSHRYISRLDYQKTHGWWVRIRRKSNSCSKLFSDGVCGGKQEALDLSIKWRDEQLIKSPKQNRRETESSAKRIKTGVPGLSVSIMDGARGQLVHLQVSILRGGKRTCTRFSISKWGLRVAIWKSCVALAKGSTGQKNVQAMATALFETCYPELQTKLKDITTTNRV